MPTDLSTTQVFATLAELHICPRCLGGVPNNPHRGAYSGALSRTDNTTHVCSSCGTDEAIQQFEGRLFPIEHWVASRYDTEVLSRYFVDEAIAFARGEVIDDE